MKGVSFLSVVVLVLALFASIVNADGPKPGGPATTGDNEETRLADVRVESAPDGVIICIAISGD